MMKNMRLLKLNKIVALGLILITASSCERDFTNEVVDATFPNIAEVYTDNPVNLTDQFFISFSPTEGANPNAFGTDDTEAYEGTSSIRIDVPAPNDPDGGFVGGIFLDRGAGRNLTSFDALTFWVKGSTTAVVDVFGFGTDFVQDRYAADINGVTLSTDWKQVIIPIPDPSKLVQERGMFKFAAGTASTGGLGYTIWIDEIRFENLGTVAQPRPAIVGGQDVVEQTFNGSSRTVNGLQQTWNLANGQDVTVLPAPGYFDFSSSNVLTAEVDEAGVVSILTSGTATITAELAGLEAEGSLTLESLGDFTQAPTPDEDPANVISIFSDAYQNVPVDYYNGFFAPFQTTLGGAPPIDISGNQVINYTELNFVGIGTFLNVNPIDITQMTHLHVDINVQEAIDAGDFIRLEILNGVQTSNEISGSRTISGDDLTSNAWESFDIPLGEFAGLSARDQVGLLFFISDATISNIYVDNIYYYKEVIDPTPNVDDSAATEVALPVGFESTTLTYNFFGFEGAFPSIIPNPDATGINPTGTVMATEKSVGAQFFAGNVLDLDAPMDLSTTQKLRIKVWSPKANIPIRVALETAGGGNQIFIDANVTTANTWEELEFDFAGNYNPALDYQRVIVFFEFIDGLAGDGSTYYFDDIQLLNE